MSSDPQTSTNDCEASTDRAARADREASIDGSAVSTAIRNELVRAPQILVVCTGNICRSPMGEVVLGAKLRAAGNVGQKYAVASCGVSSEEHGNPIYPPAARILRAHGYEVPVRRAHRATSRELTESGLILAMTSGHARSLRSMCADAGVPLSRIHLWREFDGSGLTPAAEGCFGPGGTLDRQSISHSSGSGYSDFYSFDDAWDVPDPWYSGDFAATFSAVEAGAQGIVALLAAN